MPLPDVKKESEQSALDAALTKVEQNALEQSEQSAQLVGHRRAIKPEKN